MSTASRDQGWEARLRATGLATGMVAMVVLAAGCGGSEQQAGASQPSESGGGGSEAVATSVLTMKDNAFDPRSAAIDGTTFKLVNEGKALHNLSIEGEGVDYDVQPGETEKETLGVTPGTYSIFCKYHRQQGMKGTLTVR